MSTERVAGDRPIKVIFIAGKGRCGSTLLDRLLGSLPGFISCGELVFFWERGLLREQNCGCGQSFSKCRFWGVVLDNLWSEMGNFDPVAVTERHRELIQIRNIPAMAWRADSFFTTNAAKEHLMLLAALYRSIARVAGCEVIVDSSKWPAYAFFLRHVRGLDLRVVHMVRDPRAIAFSWTKRYLRPEITTKQEFMPRYKPAVSAFWWVVNDILCSWLGSRGSLLRIRYEDFAREPRTVLHKIMAYAGCERRYNIEPTGDGWWTVLQTQHTVAGNPMRFLTGRVLIQEDREWLEKMTWGQKMLVSIITAPWLIKRGYSLIPPAADKLIPSPKDSGLVRKSEV